MRDREKFFIMSDFSFSHSVFKRLGLVWKSVKRRPNFQLVYIEGSCRRLITFRLGNDFFFIVGKIIFRNKENASYQGILHFTQCF